MITQQEAKDILLLKNVSDVPLVGTEKIGHLKNLMIIYNTGVYLEVT